MGIIILESLYRMQILSLAQAIHYCPVMVKVNTNKKPFLLEENLILAFFTEASIKKLESNL